MNAGEVGKGVTVKFDGQIYKVSKIEPCKTDISRVHWNDSFCVPRLQIVTVV